jgi:hypothetical protein
LSTLGGIGHPDLSFLWCHVNKTVTLSLEDRLVALDFVKEKANEIAEFDDQDEAYVAMMPVVAKIAAQLKV